jgi:nitrate reductase delta subunit
VHGATPAPAGAPHELPSGALRALGWLLHYPDEVLLGALPELERELGAEPALSPATCSALARLLDELRSAPRIELEERYVALFDRTRGLSLHLHEHVHGEARERGAAMVQLRQVYERAGLELLPGELPDYLPAICEFLSLRPRAEARALLCDAAAVLERIRSRLEQRASRYAAVLAALAELSGADPARRADPDPAAGALPELAALDAAWQDAPVVFGPDAQPAACSAAGSRLQIGGPPSGGAGPGAAAANTPATRSPGT